MLKFFFENEADIPEGLRDHYKESELPIGGKKVKGFVLQVQGAVPKERLDEFRDNNTKLLKSNEDLQARIDGLGDLDVEAARKALETVAGLDNGTLAKKEELDALFAQRTEAIVKKHDKTLADKDATIASQRNQLTAVLIDQAVLTEATKEKLRPEAALDIQSRARKIFSLNGDNQVVALEADGTTQRYNADGTAPLDVTSWIKDQKSEAPHLFTESNGSGAGGSGSGGAKTKNPWKKDTFNLTDQMTIQRSNPALAAKLKSEAGVK